MKLIKHKLQFFFFCKLDEKNNIKFINLNSYENKYSYKLNCKINLVKNNLLKTNFKIPKIKKKNYKDFINQYIF